MNSQYYLVAQLPAFSTSDTDKKLPITVKRFKELCSRFMSKKSYKMMADLSLLPGYADSSSESVFLNSWYKKERILRIALAIVRAQRMNKDVKTSEVVVSADVLQIARTAVSMDNPYNAELYLNKFRLNVIDSLVPLDTFSEDAVFAYGLRLMLTERIQKFDKERGLASYHKIYDRILGENK